MPRHATPAWLITTVTTLLAVFGLLYVPSEAQLPKRTRPVVWSIGYLWPFGDPSLSVSEIEWGGLTHLVHYGAVVNAGDGALDLSTMLIDENADRLVSAGHAAGAKVLLALIQANWAGQTTTLEQATIHRRIALIEGIVDVVTRYGYDGVSVDSEPVSATAMSLLASDLRSALGGKLLIAAAAVDQADIFRCIQSSLDRNQHHDVQSDRRWKVCTRGITPPCIAATTPCGRSTSQ